MRARTIAYICGRCNTYVNVEEGQNCKCTPTNDRPCNTEFKSFYSPETKTMITSSRQMDRVYKKHGLRPLGDAPFRKKLEAINKDREGYIKARHQNEMNIKYKPGSNVRFSDHQQRLIPHSDWMREKASGH